MQPFFCQDIKEVLKEKDKLLKLIKDMESQHETEKNEFIEKYNAQLKDLQSENVKQLQAMEKKHEE